MDNPIIPSPSLRVAVVGGDDEQLMQFDTVGIEVFRVPDLSMTDNTGRNFAASAFKKCDCSVFLDPSRSDAEVLAGVAWLIQPLPGVVLCGSNPLMAQLFHVVTTLDEVLEVLTNHVSAPPTEKQESKHLLDAQEYPGLF